MVPSGWRRIVKITDSKAGTAQGTRRRVRYTCGVILLFSVLMVVSASPFEVTAQDQSQPLVAFVVDSDLQTLSLTDLGPTGLSHLAEIFRSLGARVDYIELGNPIEPEVNLLVLARPIQSLTIPQAVRIWIYLQQGNNLLLALDPEGHYLGFANINSQVSRSG